MQDSLKMDMYCSQSNYYQKSFGVNPYIGRT